MNKCKKSKIFDHVEKRRLSTKAQGLSLNVIIVAAIALIVLIVLWAIFTGRMGQTVTKLEECNSCMDASKCEIADPAKNAACPGYVPHPSTGSPSIPVGSTGPVCCLIEKK
jgi:hypothetical protein